MENLAEPARFDKNRRTPGSSTNAAPLANMIKTYSEMTAVERLADRIAKNREIDRRVKESQSAARTPTEVGGRQKAAGNALTEFQRIKKDRGIDAASDFVRSKIK